MKVSHIVTVGCSFTEGNGLEDKKDAWPFELGKLLGVDVVNIARGGSGNDGIFRRTQEYFYEDINNENNPLYVIMWTSITRREKWDDKEKRYKCYDNLMQDPGSIDYIENFNILEYYKQSMHYRTALRNLFKLHNVPYIFVTGVQALIGVEKINIPNIAKQQANNHVSISLNDPYDIGDVPCPLPMLHCGHWTKESHRVIAEHIYKNTRERYKVLTIKPSKNYLSLKAYINMFEPWATCLYPNNEPF